MHGHVNVNRYEMRATIWIILLPCIFLRIEHYENLPMQYTEKMFGCKNENVQCTNFDIFLIFALKEKIGIPLHTPVLLYKSGV